METMKSITENELSKIVSKSTVEDIKGRRGYVNVVVDLGDDLVKNIAVKASDEGEAREKALSVIIDEPDGIRGFTLKESK